MAVFCWRKLVALHLATLICLVFILCVILIFVIVFSVMFYSVFKHRKSSGRTPATFHESTTIEIMWTVIPTIILLLIVVLSGLYPATFIARFRAGSFLKESKLPSSMPSRVRNGLVIFQFVVSVSLISASILMQQQLNLMKNQDLGFDKNQVVNIKLYGYLWWRAYSETDVFKNEFLKNPNILAVGRTGSLIGERLSMETVVPEGKDPDRDLIPPVRVLRIDEDYLDAMDIKLVAGRNFSNQFNDSTSFIINEKAAQLFNMASPIAESLDNYTRNHRKGKIVGVVKDYHFVSLHDEIEPLIMEYEPGAMSYLTLKIRAGKTSETLEFIQKTVSSLAPNSLFAYEFLDDRLNTIYKAEDSMGKIVQFFSGLAITIACLGLLGLSAYTVESRSKEISIRKVFGSSTAQLIWWIYSGYLKIALIATLIAWGVGYYWMKDWLNGFAFKQIRSL